MDDLTVTGNLIEALLWSVFTICLAVMAYRADGRRRRLWSVLAVAFLAFSISDIIESRTGAWWHPWSLLVLKASCIAVFLWGVYEYRKIGRAQSSAACSQEKLAGFDGNSGTKSSS